MTLPMSDEQADVIRRNLELDATLVAEAAPRVLRERFDLSEWKWHVEAARDDSLVRITVRPITPE